MEVPKPWGLSGIRFRISGLGLSLVLIPWLRGQPSNPETPESEKEEQMARRNAAAYLGIAVVVGLLAVSTFNGSYVTVDPASPDVILVESRWWGLSKHEHVIKWIKDVESDGPAWMAKDSRGRWYPCILEQGEREYAPARF